MDLQGRTGSDWRMTRTMKATLVVVAGAAWLLAPGQPAAQPPTALPPAQQPLIYSGDMKYLGSFTLPTDDGKGGLLIYGGSAMGLGADGSSLYYGCVYGTSVARVRIPDLGEVAPVLEPCQGVPNLNDVNPGDPNGKLLGGVLAWKGRMVVSGYASYDGGNRATRSHFIGATIATARGPYTVGDHLPGLVGGYMGVVPDEWRSLLGGPALTGLCCISIISRSSYGPAVSAFDPDLVGTGSKSPATLLIGYPHDHQTLGPYEGAGPFYSGATRLGGVFFPSGTRSLMFVGRHGSGFCYGDGTKDPSLHLKPHAGGVWCFDPTDLDKGAHGYPYKHMVWAYDASDLAGVAAGRTAPWDVRPYAAWTLPEMGGDTGDANIRGATYDPATRRLYISTSTQPLVHVYEMQPGTSAGPPPEVCGDRLDNDGDGEVDEGCADDEMPSSPPPDGGAPGGGGGGDTPGTDGDAGNDDGGGRKPFGHPPPAAGGAWDLPRVLATHGVEEAAIAACGSSVHVAYGRGAIYYRRSVADGEVWSEWQQLGDGAVAGAQAMACDGDTLVLMGTRGGGDVWTWISRDGGVTWRVPVKLSQGLPAVEVASAVAGATVTGAWVEHGASVWAIHARRSDDGGATWTADQMFRPAGRAGSRPSLVLDSRGAVVAWTAGTTIEVRRFARNQWVAVAPVVPTETASLVPSLVPTAGGLAAAAVVDAADGPGLAVVQSTDGGSTWTAMAALGGAPDRDVAPHLAARRDLHAIVWASRRDGASTTQVLTSTDAGQRWSAPARVFTSAALAPRAAWSSGALHVVAVEANGVLRYARRPIG